MIPNHQANVVVSSVSTANSAAFGISSKDTAHILGILRGQIYTDKILAVLREYASNAWDANRMAGRGDEPIVVHLPTKEDPQLRIKDHGPGLSPADVFTVYSQYGASTKRDSDVAVGCLGIGSKSGFAYATSFTIISCHGGQRSIYVAALDASDLGVVNLLSSEDCGDETGVEIQISAKAADVFAFTSKAETLFAHFSPRPLINCTIPQAPEGRVFVSRGALLDTIGEYAGPDIVGTVDYTGLGTGGGWTAVMGCVAYRIRLAELALPSEHMCLHKLSGTLHFPIGAVEFAASREELRYTDRTKAALARSFCELVDGYLSHALKLVEDSSTSFFGKRMALLALRELDLPLPDEYEHLSKQTTKLFDSVEAVGIVINHAGHLTQQVTITTNLRFLIDDTGKKLKGYQIGSDDYVVQGVTKRRGNADVLRAKLDAVLVAALLDGAKVELLSTLYWYVPGTRSRGSDEHRAKHRARMFVLSPEAHKDSMYWPSIKSARWTVVDRTPDASDTYVIIEGFESKGGDIYSRYRTDYTLAEAFGEPLPPVYGYKTTAKKPITSAIGTSYFEWRKTFHARLLTPERIAMLVEWEWAMGMVLGTKDRDRVFKSLGKKHPISTLLRRVAVASTKCAKFKGLSALHDVSDRNESDSEYTRQRNDLLARYPLLSMYGLDELWSYHKDRADAWAGYVQAIDRAQSVLTIT